MADELTSISPEDFAADVLSFITDDAVEDDTPAPEAAEDTPDEGTAAEDQGEGTTETEEAASGKADATGRLHGEDGKFVPKTKADEADVEAEADASAAADEADEEAGDEPPEEYELDIDDPDVASLLQKYGGDLNKALKGAVEAQRTLGRQGGEIGELRKLEGEVEALKAMIPSLASRQTAPVVDYAALTESDPQNAAQLAAKNGDVDAMMAAVDVWKEDEPFEAAVFLGNVMHGYELDEIRKEMAAQQTAPVVATADQEIAKVIARHPDLEKFLPAIGEVAKGRPLLQDALQRGTPAQQADALETCYEIARSRQSADTSDAVSRARVRVADEGKQARADAAVVSASRSSAASGDQPTRVDQFLDSFETTMRKQGLLADEE